MGGETEGVQEWPGHKIGRLSWRLEHSKHPYRNRRAMVAAMEGESGVEERKP